MGAPPALNRQKLWLQNISFQSFCRISGYSFLINRLLALLYALINLLSSDFGWARNMILRSDIFKNLPSPIRNRIRQYLFSVFYNQNQMITE